MLTESLSELAPRRWLPAVVFTPQALGEEKSTVLKFWSVRW